ncbi:MAG: tRNA 2-thiocytidine(32) synthetase TtcA, partial [Myxococcota bacterium]
MGEPRTGVRLERKLLDHVGRASQDFALIEPGDRILVGLSGGKDSYALIWLLRLVQRRVPFDFEMIACNLDQGHPGFPQHVIEEWWGGHRGAPHKGLRDT